MMMAEPEPSKVKVALVTLVGLPGSGKSTLCLEIAQAQSQFQPKTKVLILGFDEFIPIEIQSTFPYLTNSNNPPPTPEHGPERTQSPGKILRTNFIQTVSYLISKVLEIQSLQLDEEVESELMELLHPEMDHVLPRINFVRILLENLRKSSRMDFENLIILIDDNNYYRSMRNDFCQLAKLYRIGFCILYVKEPISVCLERNSERGKDSKVRVPNQVILDMSTKLEEPDPVQDQCQYIFTYSSSSMTTNDPKAFSSIIKETLEAALLSPVSLANNQGPESLENLLAQRRICEENEIHQADLILRNWIHNQMQVRLNLPTTGSDFNNSEELQSFRKELLERKNKVLSALRSGESVLVSRVQDNFAFEEEVLNLVSSVNE